MLNKIDWLKGRGGTHGADDVYFFMRDRSVPELPPPLPDDARPAASYAAVTGELIIISDDL